jgi:hypothetical protein
VLVVTAREVANDAVEISTIAMIGISIFIGIRTIDPLYMGYLNMQFGG